MRVGFSTGFAELGNYWGSWPFTKMYGGSEHIVVEVACALAELGHEVTVRLPYETPSTPFRGVRWVGSDSAREQYDLLFAFDDYDIRDHAQVRALVACRSDPPRHTNFDRLIFLSRTHARLMGFADSPSVGGGVSLKDYEKPRERIPRRVICTSSPDRCSAAAAIGKGFDFVHSYRPVPGMPPTVELTRAELVELQLSAQVFIYPLDPTRPSDFFSMATLEAMAAGTPVVVSDADSMPELWADAAIVLKRPIDLGEWNEQVEQLLTDRRLWRRQSVLGRGLAEKYDWSIVAQKYLDAARS